MKLRYWSTLISLLCVCVLWAGSAQAGSAEEAWYGLVGEKFSVRPEFAYVENNPELPNVLIYGDSISIGYTQRVRGMLRGRANVYRLHCNGGDSGSFIAKMNTMHDTMRAPGLDSPWDFEWDIIHFNVGLHDLKYVSETGLDKVNGKQVSSITEYQQNLREIVAYLERQAPDAKLIFATTTPVPEGELGRFAGDAQRYNDAALEVLGRTVSCFSFTVWLGVGRAGSRASAAAFVVASRRSFSHGFSKNESSAVDLNLRIKR